MENNDFINKLIQKANQTIQTLNNVETKGRQNLINLVNAMTLIEQLVQISAEQVRKYTNFSPTKSVDDNK